MPRQDLNRRSVLYGTAVIGAASLLARSRHAPTIGEAEGTVPWGTNVTTGTGEGGSAGSSPAPGDGSAAALPPPAGPGRAAAGPEGTGTFTNGLTGRVGATLSPAALGARTWSEAARKFDARVGRPMAASASRMFFSGVTLGSSADLVRAFVETGTSAVMSFRPSRIHSTTEIATLKRTIRECQNAGLKIDAICLWHEPNDITKTVVPFRTGAEYIDYVRYYGPAVVEMGVPLAYIPLVLTTDGALQESYFPGTTWRGKPLVTHIYPDFYCMSQYVQGVRMDASVRLADAYGLRLGLGEFGQTNSHSQASRSDFAAYMRYLRGVYAGRENRGSCIYWFGGSLGDPHRAGYDELGTFYEALTA